MYLKLLRAHRSCKLTACSPQAGANQCSQAARFVRKKSFSLDFVCENLD